jgi:hypothetical protein
MSMGTDQESTLECHIRPWNFGEHVSIYTRILHIPS